MNAARLSSHLPGVVRPEAARQLLAAEPPKAVLRRFAGALISLH
jgi:hypothetical protein